MKTKKPKIVSATKAAKRGGPVVTQEGDNLLRGSDGHPTEYVCSNCGHLVAKGFGPGQLNALFKCGSCGSYVEARA